MANNFLINKHFKQAKLHLKKAEGLVAEQMVLIWDDLIALRKLFRLIPDCDIRKIILRRIQSLENTNVKSK